MIVVDGTPNGVALLGSLLALVRGVVVRSQDACGEPELTRQSLQWLLLLLGPALLEPALHRCIPACTPDRKRASVRRSTRRPSATPTRPAASPRSAADASRALLHCTRSASVIDKHDLSSRRWHRGFLMHRR